MNLKRALERARKEIGKFEDMYFAEEIEGIFKGEFNKKKMSKCCPTAYH